MAFLFAVAVAEIDGQPPAAGTLGASQPPASDSSPETREQPAQSAALAAFVVAENTDKVFLTPNEIRFLQIFRGMGDMPSIDGLTPNLRSLYVETPLRMLQLAANEASTSSILVGDALKSLPAATFDGRLDTDIPYSLAGRGDSLSPFPQDQGIVLRGVGADTGTETRAVVDGIPANDPYWGWVVWPAVPHEAAASAEVVPGAGAAAWGNGDVGGVVQFFTTPPAGRLTMVPGSLEDGGPPDPNVMKQVVVEAGELAASAGDFGTRSLEAVESEPFTEGVLQLEGRDYSTGGYTLVADGERGPIDTAAWSRHDWLEARWRQLLGKNIVLTATLSGYRVSNGDGTPYQVSRETGESLGLGLVGRGSSSFSWTADAFVRVVGSSATFSSVNASRTLELPAIDLNSAPATGAGASWSGTWEDAGSSTTFGLETHIAKGDSRENTGYNGANYTTALSGGGEQDDTAIYVLRDQRLSSTLRLTIGGRVTYWDQNDGHMDSAGAATGVPSFDVDYGTASGVQLSPEAGLIWRPSDSWAVHANGQQGFSRPTLGELYGTTGQYSEITQGNPELHTEWGTSLEIGVSYSFITEQERKRHSGQFGALRPLRPLVTVGANGFSNYLRDSIGEVTQAGDPLVFTTAGPTPVGYLIQDYANIDRSRIEGLDLYTRLIPGDSVELEAHWQFLDPTIEGDGAFPNLVGKEIAGDPRHTGTLTANWNASKNLRFSARFKVFGAQFQDNGDTLRLAEANSCDVEATLRLNAHTVITLAVENVGDTRLDVSRSTHGLSYVGPPRLAESGIKVTW